MASNALTNPYEFLRIRRENLPPELVPEMWPWLTHDWIAARSTPHALTNAGIYFDCFKDLKVSFPNCFGWSEPQCELKLTGQREHAVAAFKATVTLGGHTPAGWKFRKSECTCPQK